MGYTTEFKGQFGLDKPLTEQHRKFLTLLSQTRRMKRKVDQAFGIEGEFFVFGTGFAGQDSDSTIIDGNSPPSTQPSLWCQWLPNEDGTAIVWDGNEKFNSYVEWLLYIIEKILKPNGYVVNGDVRWSGEENDDYGIIRVIDNVVYTQEDTQSFTIKNIDAGMKSDYKLSFGSVKELN